MSLTGLVVVAAVLVAAAIFGVVRSHRLGRVRATDDTQRLTAQALGGEQLGERATLLQFSSAFCRPCVATRHMLGDVAGRLPGVRHVEVDAESQLELVRALGVASTPTTLLLDGAGVVRRRAVGVPRRDEVLAAINALL